MSQDDQENTSGGATSQEKPSRIIHKDDNVLYSNFASTRSTPEHSFVEKKTTSKSRVNSKTMPSSHFHWAGGIILDYLNGQSEVRRVERGLELYRDGKVQHVEFLEDAITAWVVGTQPEPFDTVIGITPMQVHHREFITGELKNDDTNIFTLLSPDARDSHIHNLLFNEEHIEYVSCDCPDYRNRQLPCKHIIALGYAVADTLTEDPREILLWRGITNQTVLDRVEFLQTRKKHSPTVLAEMLGTSIHEKNTAGQQTSSEMLGQGDSLDNFVSLVSDARRPNQGSDTSALESVRDFWGDDLTDMTLERIPDFTPRLGNTVGDQERFARALRLQVPSTSALLGLQDEINELYYILTKDARH